MTKKKVKNSTRRDLLNHSDEVLDMFCESCFKDGIKDITAVGFCVDCVTFFCKTCLKFHTKFLPDHVQKCHNDMPKDFCQENCNTHKNEIVKYYCTKCDLLACSTCKINDHKGCESVQYVPTLLSKFEEKREYKSFDVVLQATEEKLQETKLVIEQGYDYAEQSKEETKSVIKVCKDNTAKLLDDLEREVKYKIDEISTENKQNLEKSSKKLSELETKFQSIKSEYESNKLAYQRCKTFTLVKKCSNVVKSIKNDIENLKHETEIHEMSFEPANIIRTTGDFGKLNIAKPGENQNSGHISENRKPAERNQTKYSTCFWLMCIVTFVISVIAGMIQGNISYDKYEKVNKFSGNESYNSRGSIIREKEIILSMADVKSHVNDEFSLVKICYLSRNYLIAIDKNNNLALLISSVERKIVADFLLGKKPWDATKVRKNQFAVTFSQSSEIHFIEFKKLHDSKTFSWSVIKKVNIQLSKNNFNFIMYRNEKIFTSKRNKITIFDMNMNKLKTIFFNKTDTEVNGYVTTRMNAETLHVLSLIMINSLTVLRVTPDGVYETFYTHKKLVHPGEMTTDDKGNVYVCGIVSNNIFMLSSDITQGEELLNETDGLRLPLYIAFGSEDKKLFIYSSQAKYISVFRFV